MSGPKEEWAEGGTEPKEERAEGNSMRTITRRRFLAPCSMFLVAGSTKHQQQHNSKKEYSSHFY
jgi:hypothetical protein